MIVTILGLGEAGSALAADLIESGITVNAWDPEPKQVPPGVNLAPNDQAAINGANLILSVNLASVAAEVARSALPVLTRDQLYADLNTASPGKKQEIAEILHPSGVLFADVALLAPVPGRGLRTPALVSGPGARQFHNLLAPYGMPVRVLDDQAGSAAGRKLVRSIFMKGIAAVVIECLEAAARLDCETWTREQILAVIRNEALLDRFITGSRTHAARRIHEMQAATQLLAEIHATPYMTQATVQWLMELERNRQDLRQDLPN